MTTRQTDTAVGGVPERRLAAEAALHRALGRAHAEYATLLTALTANVGVEDTPVIRGSTQRRIVALPGRAPTGGTTSGGAPAATTGDEPNCHAALKALVG